MWKTTFLLLLLPSQVAAPVPSFCERLAPQLQMVTAERGRPGAVTGEWRIDTLSGIGPILFGGTATTSISTRPVGDSVSRAELDRIDGMCASTKSGSLCRILGPVELKMRTRRGEAQVEAKPGERAEVEIRGTKVFCRDPQAFGS
jgi:hypothetical protein